jgi:hypothetical protein
MPLAGQPQATISIPSILSLGQLALRDGLYADDLLHKAAIGQAQQAEPKQTYHVTP